MTEPPLDQVEDGGDRVDFQRNVEFDVAKLATSIRTSSTTPRDLAGRRVGIRSCSLTTGTWIRGILANDYGVDLERVRWLTFEDPHVAEYRDPPAVERAAPGSDLMDMLLGGEIDAATAAEDWRRRHRALQVNHMVVVRGSLCSAHPDAVREVFRLLQESKRAAGLPAAGQADACPLGVEPNRRSLEMAIEYAHQQGLIPRRFAVDALFNDLTRSLGA